MLHLKKIKQHLVVEVIKVWQKYCAKQSEYVLMPLHLERDGIKKSKLLLSLSVCDCNFLHPQKVEPSKLIALH